MARDTDYSGDDTGDPVDAAPVSTSGPEIKDNAELDAAFEAAFGDHSEAELNALAKEDDAPAPKPVSPAQQALRDARSKLAAREQKEELEEEGLTSVDQPDGVEPGTEAGDSAEGEETDEEAPVVGQDGVETPAESAIDPFHKWAAQQVGWTPAEISKLEKADPALAAKTLQTVADSYTALSRQALGNVAPGSITGTPAAQNQPAQSEYVPTPKLDKIIAGLKQFSEDNGEDIGHLVSALSEELVAPFKALLASQRVAEQNAQKNEADSTFNGIRKDFGDFYGKDGEVNPVQQARITKLAELSNQIRAGAKAQGKSVSIKECINQAHSVLTADLRATTARKEIVAGIQKRSRSITAKPNARRSPGTATGSKSKQAAASAYEMRAAEVGFDLGDFE